MNDLVLGIDTVGRGGAVALADAGAVLGLREHDPSLGYAEELFGLLDALLEDCGRTRDELSAIAVASGPGSFTGLRIGVMTAKALAFGLGRPLLAAPTLDLVAAAAGPGRWTAAIDAGGGFVWSASFEVSAGAVVRAGDVSRVRPEELTGEVVVAPPLAAGRPVPALAGQLARLGALRQPPVEEVDVLTLVPDYAAVSQAERVHGIDLSEELRRPIEPRGWES